MIIIIKISSNKNGSEERMNSTTAMSYRHEICLFLEVTLDLSLNRRRRRRLFPEHTRTPFVRHVIMHLTFDIFHSKLCMAERSNSSKSHTDL